MNDLFMFWLGLGSGILLVGDVSKIYTWIWLIGILLIVLIETYIFKKKNKNEHE